MKIKRFVPYILSIVILMLCVVAVSENNTRIEAKKASTTNDSINREMKGVWVSYITLDMQSTDKSEQSFVNKVKSIISTTKKNGFNTIIVQVRPFCDALYESEYFPWSHILSGTQGEYVGYDPLDIICDISHENNISVHAWINPYRVASKNTPSKLSNNNPYSKDNTLGFEYNGSIYLDPSSKKAQNLIIDGVKEIVRNYDIDGIQFDDYFYPENSDDIDQKQYEQYKNNTEKPLSKQMWRAENVNNLIKKVYECIHKESDSVMFGISPQGNINNNINLGADVKKWCTQNGYIDYICPQIYFSLDNPSLTFEDSLSQWLNLKSHKNLFVYIGLAGYKGGTEDDEGTWLDNDDILKTQIEICEEKKTDGFMLYSYESFLNKDNKAEIENVVKHITGIKG